MPTGILSKWSILAPPWLVPPPSGCWLTGWDTNPDTVTPGIMDGRIIIAETTIVGDITAAATIVEVTAGRVVGITGHIMAGGTTTIIESADFRRAQEECSSLPGIRSFLMSGRLPTALDSPNQGFHSWKV